MRELSQFETVRWSSVGCNTLLIVPFFLEPNASMLDCSVEQQERVHCACVNV